MALSPGTRLGVYEVTAQIGEGGMGQVYRARDTKLNRQVAIKVLPDLFANDAERLARFTREAQTLASLNHPNIAHLYGLEGREAQARQEGQEGLDGRERREGSGPFLVMELVEGPTLEDMLAPGFRLQASAGRSPKPEASGLPVDEALPIARQIAEALEAAHELGIVHRDLKPANIKIRADGVVKVLDFGLAKALSMDVPGGTSDGFADSPTMASPARTAAGIILGTAAYMSPEQARGKVVDKRADIWAFGCVLYEMLTGVATFSGDTTTDILAAVIQREPDWSRLPSAVPPRITSLLRRCLQRNPKDRLRDIADARFEIEDALRPGENRPVASVPAAASRTAGRYVGPALWLVAGVALTSAVFLLLGALGTPESVASTLIRAIVALPPDTTIALDRGSAVTLSPDGHRLVYSARSKGKAQLYVRSLDSFESLPIAGTDAATNAFFSPDGQWVGFFGDGKLKKVSLDGGAPVAIADARTPRGEAWGPDNLILMTPVNNTGVSRVSALGGSPEPASTLVSGELSHRWPRFLPDGKAILFTIWNDIGWEPARIAVQRLDSQQHKVIVPAGGGYARFISDGVGTSGYLIYARAEGLMAAKFDTARLEITGQAVPVLDGLITNLSGGAHYDVSATGTLAYVPGVFGEEDRDLAWVTLDGTRTPVLRIHNMSRFWVLSPDGTRILRNNTSGSSKDIWIDDLTRGTSTRVTSQDENFAGAWSNDGKWVAFSRGVPVSNLYRRSTDGSEIEERLTTSPITQNPESWSPDGTSLSYTDFDPVSGSDISILSVPVPNAAKGGAPIATRPFVKTRFNEGNSRFSPDGRWLAYQSNESGRFEVYVRAFPEGVRKWPVSTEGGVFPMWSPSGREIFYRSTSNMMMAAAVDTASDFRVEKLRVLFDAASYENTFAVAPDGKRFLMMPLLAPEGAPTQVHLVLNWLDELRQRVK